MRKYAVSEFLPYSYRSKPEAEARAMNVVYIDLWFMFISCKCSLRLRINTEAAVKEHGKSESRSRVNHVEGKFSALTYLFIVVQRAQ